MPVMAMRERGFHEPAHDPTAPLPVRWPFLAVMGAVAIIAIGAALRTKMFLGGRSLWLDEAMLALNLQRRSFAGLLRPLDFDQAAPIGYLWLVKIVMTCFGDGERALRTVSFIAGLVS